MRNVIWALLLALVCASLADCHGCVRRRQAMGPVQFQDGYASMDDLAKAYLEAIEKKDPDLLQKVLLTADDMAMLTPKNGRQIWSAYFMLSKRSFMDKNKAYLGQKLEFTSFTPGQALPSPAPRLELYRGSFVRFKTPDGQDGQSEINFIIGAAGSYKIFGLKYLRDELERRGLKDIMPAEGDAKFKGIGEANDIGIKIKKLPGPGDATPDAKPKP
jgi:hypothetical protein